MTNPHTMQYEVGDLVVALLERRAILFIGSGVSAAARLPEWPTLLREMIDVGFAGKYLNSDEQTELVEWAGKPDYLMLATRFASASQAPCSRSFSRRSSATAQ